MPMGTMLNARWYLDVPAAPPIGGGVLSVADVIDNADPKALMGAEYNTDACGTDLDEWLSDWCTLQSSLEEVKRFASEWDLVEGTPFVAYTGLSCMITTLDEAAARVGARFDYAESRSVDRSIAAQLDASAVNLGGPFSVIEAIGVAEAYAATVYGSTPTILVPRRYVPCAWGALLPDGDAMRTHAGSQVGAITTPITVPATAADTGTIYVTGRITLLRGKVQTLSTPQQVLDDGAGNFIEPRALAERIYVPLIECLAAKVQVTCA